MRVAITPFIVTMRVLMLLLVLAGAALATRRHDSARDPWPPE
ncbi:MAG TPA: hypothetical protein VHB98_04390 [Chloroflexota bacterium]|nr:hypothetical protein [Chloroflexota bacterium]